MIVNGKYSFKLYCGNGGGNGYIRCKVLKYWKQKRGGYHTGDVIFNINDNFCKEIFMTGHNWEDFGRVKEVKIPDTVRNKTQDVLRKEYIDPTPQENVTKYIPTLFKAVEDVTSQIKSQVQGQMRTLLLDFDYNTLAPPFAVQVEDKIKNEGLQKKLRIKYKYYLPDPQGTSNKKLFVSDEGNLVLEYDYNNTTNSQIISKMPSNILCPSGTECTGMFTIEDDGMLSLIKDGSKIWNTTTSSYKNFDEDDNQIASFSFPENVRENGYWRDTLPKNFMEKGEKLTSNNFLIFQNNKFKLTFRENKLAVVYCLDSFIEDNINHTIKNKNIMKQLDGTSKQIYYLYRVNASDLAKRY